MNKREREQLHMTYNALQSLGLSYDECEKLRRISMTLRRWHELECGDSNTYASWAIERDESNGLPYLVKHLHGQGVSKTYRYRVADRETGARKRLDSIMANHPSLKTYIQGDPRGAALYILRPGDVPNGEDVMSYYHRGICVC